MIKVMSYEFKHQRIECLYDDIFQGWVIQQGSRLIKCCETFQEASEAMDEAIQDLNTIYTIERRKKMTKKQFNKKLREMKREMNEGIKKECQRLLNSGAIDHLSYDDNYLLPKLILCVALQNIGKQYLPFEKSHMTQMKNLMNF